MNKTAETYPIPFTDKGAKLLAGYPHLNHYFAQSNKPRVYAFYNKRTNLSQIYSFYIIPEKDELFSIDSLMRSVSRWRESKRGLIIRGTGHNGAEHAVNILSYELYGKSLINTIRIINF